MTTTTPMSTAPHLLTTRQPGQAAVAHIARAVSAVVTAPARLAALLGDQFHAADDARATADGLEVTSTRWGGRTYRHPGFPITTPPMPDRRTRQETNR